MSFLVSKAPEQKQQAMPQNYEMSDCSVKLELAPIPSGHSEVDEEMLESQHALIEQLGYEEPSLFSEQACIIKTVGDQRQYKQAAGFKTSVTLESLASVMKANELCMKVKFVRPGFNSSNNVFMLSSDKLNEIFQENSNAHMLKKSELSISGGNGFATFSIKEKMPSRQHVAYSIDFTMNKHEDERMRCEHK